MGPGPSTSVTDTFSGVNGTGYHLDTANSTLLVSAGNLNRTNIDTFTNISSYVTGKFSGGGNYGGNQFALYDPVHNLLYVNGRSNVCYSALTWIKVDLTAHTSIDIYPKFSSGGCNFQWRTGFIDSSGYMYTGSTQAGLIQKYDPTTNATATNVNIFNTTFTGGILNPSDGFVYAFIATSSTYKLYKNSLTGGVTGTYVVDTGFSTSSSATQPVYNSFDNSLFVDTEGNGILKTSATSPYTSFTNDIGNYGHSNIVPNTANGGAYVTADDGGNGGTGHWQKFNASMTLTDLTSNLNTIWGSNWFGTLSTFDTVSTNAYIGTLNRTGNVTAAARYGPSASPTTVNLTSALTAAIGTTTVLMYPYSASNGTTFWTGNNQATGQSFLASSSPPALSQSGQSTTLVTVSSGIPYATLTKSDTPGTGSATYYMSNDNGATWEGPVTPGSRFTFVDSTGTQLKYKVILTGNATVSSISISYNGYSTSTLRNLKKDASADSSWVNLVWDSTMPANTQVKFRTRGATTVQGRNALYGAQWSDYYIATTTGSSGATIKANGAGGANNPVYEYMEAEITLISNDGIATSGVNSFSLNYALNAPPNFNPNYPTTGAGGAVATQVTQSSDPNWGKVKVDYSIRDIDTTSGSITPGFITPSFEYRLSNTDTWHSISGSYLDAGALTQKAVSESLYTVYTAYWSAQSQIPNQYSATTQVRVSANDSEVIYNVGTTTSNSTTLDTTPPVVSAAHSNGSSSTSTVTVLATDNTTFKDYNLTNNVTGGSDGVNASSGILQATTTAALNISTPWTLSGTSTNTVYLILRDVYGNTATTSVVAPGTLQNFDLHDISNASVNNYKLILSWTPYVSETGATFAQYEVWRSTNNNNFSLLQTVTDGTLNYVLDSTVASSTVYYYKVRTVDTDGDISPFTVVASAQPIGAGASSLPPVISQVVVDTIKNTSARVTWTTNSLSDSRVDYGPTSAYGSIASSPTFTTTHQVYVTNLQPNTTYHMKVTSTDFFTNSASNDAAGATYSFTTNGGPVITGVTVNTIRDTSATIFWNTIQSADSNVFYSLSSTLSSPTQVGTSTLVATTTSVGVYSHTVELTGLLPSTTYYFYVSSTDGSSNTTTATNNGSYYSLLTTRDTTPPTISAISEPVITDTATVVVWATDKPATSQLEYGTTASTTSGSYTTTTTRDQTLSLSHIATLTNLTKLTPYYFRVLSIDSAGNGATSNEQTFTTTDTSKITVTYISSGSTNNPPPVPTPTPTNPTTPPIITSVAAAPINTFDATIHIVGSPEYRALVSYGEVSTTTPHAPYTSTAGDAELTTTKDIKLTNLTPGASYHYTVSLFDAYGNKAQSKEQTFTTTYISEVQDLSMLAKASDLQNKIEHIIESALPSLSPPAISTPVVDAITQDSATVSWGTNIKAYTVLDYTDDVSYQKDHAYNAELSDIQTASTTHSLSLKNLLPNTTYHMSVHSFIFPQVVSKTPDFTFTTKAGPIAAQILDVKTDSFRVLWATDAGASSAIDYTDLATRVTQTISNKVQSKQHDLTAPNLPPGHTYSVRAYGYSVNGNQISTNLPLQVTTRVDKTDPLITSLRIDSNLIPGRTDIVQSIISWKTDKPSTSAVYYQEGVGAANIVLKNKIENDTGFVQDHVVLVPNLKPSTIYRIQVSSTDQSGNTLLLPVRSIVTPQQSESIVDIIFKNFSSTFNFIH